MINNPLSIERVNPVLSFLELRFIFFHTVTNKINILGSLCVIIHNLKLIYKYNLKIILKINRNRNIIYINMIYVHVTLVNSNCGLRGWFLLRL